MGHTGNRTLTTLFIKKNKTTLFINRPAVDASRRFIVFRSV